MGAQDYSQASTAEAFAQHVHSQQFDHLSLIEAHTLDSALEAAGIDLAEKPRVLDVGCGEGRLLRSWAARGAVCVGCDPSEALIAAARAAQEDAAAPTVEYYTADATTDMLLPGGWCSALAPLLPEELATSTQLLSTFAEEKHSLLDC